MQTPLVTIGIPTYNRPSGLRKALDSAIYQTYQNIEILISDNCSTTEDTKKILEEYKSKDSRIIYTIQSNNIGAEKNFNFVLDQAKGTYFMWLADDDWLDDNYIEECMLFLEKNPDYILCSGTGKYYKDGHFVLKEDMVILSHENIVDRLLYFFKKVGYNGTFYGLSKTENWRSLQMGSYIASDWVMISELLVKGKINSVDNFYLHRSLDGASNSELGLAKIYKFNLFQRTFYWHTLAFTVIKKISPLMPNDKHSNLFLLLKIYTILQLRYSNIGKLLKKYKIDLIKNIS